MGGVFRLGDYLVYLWRGRNKMNASYPWKYILYHVQLWNWIYLATDSAYPPLEFPTCFSRPNIDLSWRFHHPTTHIRTVASNPILVLQDRAPWEFVEKVFIDSRKLKFFFFSSALILPLLCMWRCEEKRMNPKQPDQVKGKGNQKNWPKNPEHCWHWYCHLLVVTIPRITKPLWGFVSGWDGDGDGVFRLGIFFFGEEGKKWIMSFEWKSYLISYHVDSPCT